MAIRRPINLGQPQTTIGFAPPMLPNLPMQKARLPGDERVAEYAGAGPSLAAALGRSTGAAETPTVESGHWLEALAAALEGGIHGRAAYRGQQQQENLLAQELARQSAGDKREAERHELEMQQLQAEVLAGPETWSEPFEFGGTQVQRNSRSNQYRPVVPAPPAGMMPNTWGPMSPEMRAQYPNLNPGDVQQNQVTGEIRTIPGAQQRARTTERQQRAVQTAISTLEQGERVLTMVGRARQQVNGFTAGMFGAATRGIPGTPAFDLDRTIDTIKANLGFEALSQMRQESPTGGALGQVAVIELQMLQAVQASLDSAQTPAQLDRALQDVERYLQGRAQRTQRFIEAYEQDFGVTQQPAAPTNDGTEPEQPRVLRWNPQTGQLE